MTSPTSGPASANQPGEETFGNAYNGKIITRLLPYLAPHKRLIAVAIVATLVFSATQISAPWLIKIGIDEFIKSGNFSGLTWIVALFLGTALINWLSNFIQNYTIARVGQGILFRLRGDMFAHLQKLSLSYFDKTEVGRIMSRVQGDVFQLQEFLAVAIVTVGEVLSLVGIIVALILLNMQLGLISMSVWPLLVLIVIFWQPLAKKSFIRVRKAVSTVNGALNENITGVRVVQSMNRQDRNLQLFSEKNRENLAASNQATKLSSALIPLVDILTAASIGVVIFFGSSMVSNNTLEVGALIAFILYVQRFFDPLRTLTMQYTQLQRAMASGERIFELLNIEPDLVDKKNALKLPKVNGEIRFVNVSYRYSGGVDVLKNINLHFLPGETVAIVGPTGAGKTTLTSLFTRFYDVEEGRGSVLVDGHDIREISRISLASQVSMVPQEPFLFSGTIADNIQYNHTNITKQDIVNAAVLVDAHDFISDLEDGYNTYLHERGVNLSMGQRQLLSFARAIAANPRILILDEATANIDSATEAFIQNALKKVLKDRTAVVIAHRLSTIRGADKIVVLDQGEVVEVGNHQSLLDNEGLYAHLCEMNYAAIEHTPLPKNFK
jgi:ATP-binding cassette subfamily B multidrug efflux pump